MMTNFSSSISAINNKTSGSADTIVTDSPYHQKNSILLAQVAREKVPTKTLQSNKRPLEDNSNSNTKIY